MGGSSSEIEETEAEKAAAEVANKQWELYQSEFVGFEDDFIERVDNFNSDTNMANAKKTVDVQYGNAFSDARTDTATTMAANGVDPSSGKFKNAISDVTQEQVTTQGDTATRVQVGEQDKYIAGLQDISAIGMGQKAEALDGLADSATLSQSAAIADATNSFNTFTAA